MKRPYAIICADCDEPIEENDEYVSVGGNDYHLYCLEVMTTHELIEVLEKQVPKKPLKNSKEFYGRNLYSCPICNCGYFFDSNKFCYHCGQKFDWSENDDKN